MATYISSYPVVAETRLIKPVVRTLVPARIQSFNEVEFFRTRFELRVSNAFQSSFDPKTVDSAPWRPDVASLLKENASDRDIRKELPKEHLSSLEDIAALIEAQPNGRSGFLLSNGYANIFYVEGKNGEVFAVRVYWFPTSRRHWIVDAWRLDEGREWSVVRHIICPGNALL